MYVGLWVEIGYFRYFDTCDPIFSIHSLISAPPSVSVPAFGYLQGFKSDFDSVKAMKLNFKWTRRAPKIQAFLFYLV